MPFQGDQSWGWVCYSCWYFDCFGACYNYWYSYCLPKLRCSIVLFLSWWDLRQEKKVLPKSNEEFLIFWIFFNILEVLYLRENGCAPQQNSLALRELYTCSTWRKKNSWCQLLKKRGRQSKWIMTSIQPPGWRWRGRSQWRWRWRRRQCCGWRSRRCCHLPPRKPLMPFKGQERRKLAGFYDGFNSAFRK